eukprot:2747462-Pleurochrysis_carterae.AAC.1
MSCLNMCKTFRERARKVCYVAHLKKLLWAVSAAVGGDHQRVAAAKVHVAFLLPVLSSDGALLAATSAAVALKNAATVAAAATAAAAAPATSPPAVFFLRFVLIILSNLPLSTRLPAGARQKGLQSSRCGRIHSGRRASFDKGAHHRPNFEFCERFTI